MRKVREEVRRDDSLLGGPGGGQGGCGNHLLRERRRALGSQPAAVCPLTSSLIRKARSPWEAARNLAADL